MPIFPAEPAIQALQPTIEDFGGDVLLLTAAAKRLHTPAPWANTVE